MLNTNSAQQPHLKNLSAQPDTSKNSLEERVDRYKETTLNNIRFSVIIKPAIISFVALLF